MLWVNLGCNCNARLQNILNQVTLRFLNSAGPFLSVTTLVVRLQHLCSQFRRLYDQCLYIVMNRYRFIVVVLWLQLSFSCTVVLPRRMTRARCQTVKVSLTFGRFTFLWLATYDPATIIKKKHNNVGLLDTSSWSAHSNAYADSPFWLHPAAAPSSAQLLDIPFSWRASTSVCESQMRYPTFDMNRPHLAFQLCHAQASHELQDVVHFGVNS